MKTEDQEPIIRFVRLARRLEMSGLYNAAKLLWAAAFSEEIRQSNEGGISLSEQDIEKELEAAIQAMQASPGQAALAKALRNTRRAIRETSTIPLSEIPQVSVCRTCGEAYLGRPPEICADCGTHALTFREILPVWFLEPLSPHQALKALASGIDAISSLIEGLSEDQMDYYPEPGEWNMREALLHLLVAQELLAGRVDKMLAEQNPSLTGVAAWMLEDEEAGSGSQIFERLKASRVEVLDRLQSLPLESWWQTGEHEEFGQVTILQQASYFAKHERSHLLQVQQIRQAVLESG
jgi:ribosomal protein L32